MTLRPDTQAYPPRGLSREAAARYLGIGTTLFDEMVAAKEYPGPKMQHGRVVWDRFALDAAFDALPDRNDRAAKAEWECAA